MRYLASILRSKRVLLPPLSLYYPHAKVPKSTFCIGGFAMSSSRIRDSSRKEVIGWPIVKVCPRPLIPVSLPIAQNVPVKSILPLGFLAAAPDCKGVSMIYKIFCVRDKLSDFGRPFVAPNEDFAKRDFSGAVHSDPVNNAIAFAPDDYELYCLGSYDSHNATFQIDPVPEFIVRGSDLVG